MANDKQRGELIAKAIEEINRKVQSAEISALDLDILANDEIAPVSEEPVPITMQELERTFAESKTFGERFRPHTKISGAHLLDWHGHWREVTFDLKQFDEHPNTLTLLSYGNQLLQDLLGVVEPPHEEQNSGIVARCSLGQVAVGYYRLQDIAAVATLGQLIGRLDAISSVKVQTEVIERIRSTFGQFVSDRLRSEEKAADDRRKAQLSSLTEEIRQLLVEAAYVELGQATNHDLFDEAMPLDFSESAYQRLKRHKVPFSGALKMVGDGLPIPRPDDSLFLRLRDSKRDVLTRRFEAIRGKLTDRLRELMELRKALEQRVRRAELHGEPDVQLIGAGDGKRASR